MDLDGARVLDLYAGSGALGLEALSRGAAHATLIESDGGALAVLRRNVSALGLSGAEVRPGKVATVLATPPSAPYDLVLSDPPYALPATALTQDLVALVAWTGPGSVVVVERARRSEAFEWPALYVPGRVRNYGDTVLHWASRAGGPLG